MKQLISFMYKEKNIIIKLVYIIINVKTKNLTRE